MSITPSDGNSRLGKGKAVMVGGYALPTVQAPAAGGEPVSVNFDYDLVCIGSGPAGQRAAVQAAKLGKRVAIIEKRQSIGGVCLVTGTIPSKTFREAVRSFTTVPTGGIDNGINFSSRPRPTIEQLLGRVGQVIQREANVQRAQVERNDIELIHGTATFQDTHVLSVVSPGGGVRVLTARHFLIAVGTRPADPRGVKPDGQTVITSDGIMDLKRMPRTLAIVGAGVIGIEYGSMFAELGVETVVVDKRPRMLDFLDTEITDELAHQLRNKDVTLRLNEGVDRVEIINAPKRQGLIVLDSGKQIAADLILFSAGRVGAIDELNLEAAGVVADDRGRVKVNERFQTDAEHIYAAGDVIGFPALAATSAEQGRIAACNMYGVEARPMGENFPIGIYSIPEISMVGQTEQQLTEKKIPYETGVARYSETARGKILGDDSGLLKLIFSRDGAKLLGVHAIGSGATELIHVGQAVMILGGGLDYFLQTVFNYPTLAECYKVAAFNCANKLRRVKTFNDAHQAGNAAAAQPAAPNAA
jgi:NAD(P) transhydrogenase